MSQLLPTVKIPKLNTIRLYNILNEKAFCEPTEWKKWEQPVKYEQVFSRFDTLAFQIKIEDDVTWSHTSIITCKAYDRYNALAYTFTVNPLYNVSSGLDGYYYYEVRSVLTVLPRGVYQLRIHIINADYTGMPPIPLPILNEYDFYSEPIFVEDQVLDSVIIKYGHENNNMGLLAVDPDIFSVSGATTPTDVNQEYTNIGTYNGQSLYRSVLLDFLLFYATTLQGGSVWVIQANATATPVESPVPLGYAYSTSIDATYTNVGTWAGTTIVAYALNYFYHRVHGGFDTNDLTPSSKDVVYRDQEYDITQLDSIPLDTTKLTIGDGGGIPNWQALIINRILSCSYMNISGRKYVKNDGAKLEKTIEKNYPMAGWKIELADETNTMDNSYNGYDYNGDYFSDFLINV
jgi:hypothetical protein